MICGRVIFLSFSFFGILLTVAAQVPSESASRITVRGVVLTSSDRQPIANAVVMLSRDRRVLTDEQGRFAFTNIPSGSFGVSAQKDGFSCDPLLRVQPHPICYQTVNAQSGDVQLTLTLLPQAAVIGKIVTGPARPIANLAVGLLRRGIQDGRYVWTFDRQAKTDATGAYRIGGLEPGTYLLRTAAMASFGTGYGLEATRDHGYEATWYPGVSTQEAAKPLVLAAGQQIHADLQIEQSFRLINLPYTWNLPHAEGDMLYGMSGGAPIDAIQPHPSHPGHLLQVYAPDGHYTFNLCIYPPSPGGNRQPWSDGTTKPYCGFSEFTIDEKTISAPTVPLEQPVTIPLHVRVELTAQQLHQSPGAIRPPLAPAATTFSLAAGIRQLTSLNWSSANPRSDLVFNEVQPGLYSLHTFGNTSSYVASLTCGKVNLLRDPLVVRADIPPCSIQAVLRDDFATLALGLLPHATSRASTAGVRQAQVLLIPLGYTIQRPARAFIIIGAERSKTTVVPGKYLAIVCDGRELAWREPDVQKHLMTLGKIITLKPGQLQTLLLDWSPELNAPVDPTPRLGSLGVP